MTNPDVRCIGVCVNTSELGDDSRRSYLAAISDETGLPCVDPVIDGCNAIVNTIG